MSIKRRSKHISVFSMASMTDVIFLLLIFFMVVSTLVVPNAIKVNLPSSQSTATTQEPVARITIDAEGYYYISTESAPEVTMLPVEELEARLYEIGAAHDEEEEDPYVVLYADRSVSYGEIVKVLNASATAGLRMILATEALQDNSTETDV
ncbi:ExbD/TolR family protein [Porphyromonas sp.]|uniref:ExbD/TolR family protein n=1 Tax=Porphyromonas sp. TaxID=1924944 RepID=UPI003A91562D